MDIKALFEGAENGTLTYEQFEAKAKENGAKFADLSDGKYVSKSKYDSDIKSKEDTITTLNGTIATRDTDLANIQKQLEGAGADSTKLKNVTADLTALQQKYDNDMKDYQTKLASQSYEFAVKEFANTKDFTSKAAKRDFVTSMINKSLQMDGTNILGAEDFAKAYAIENEDAFAIQKNEPEPQPTPHFTSPIQENNGVSAPAGSTFGFNFVGVRSHETK